MVISSVSETFCSFLLDLIDARYTETSTFICTQYDVGVWHEKLGGTTLHHIIISPYYRFIFFIEKSVYRTEPQCYFG